LEKKREVFYELKRKRKQNRDNNPVKHLISNYTQGMKAKHLLHVDFLPPLWGDIRSTHKFRIAFLTGETGRSFFLK
jgi:hypothetical protein